MKEFQKNENLKTADQMDEYAKQMHSLNSWIKWLEERLETLREMPYTIISPSFGEKVQTSQAEEAPFACSVEKMVLWESIIKQWKEIVYRMTAQIISAIENVDSEEVKKTFQYRIIYNRSWEQIGNEIGKDVDGVARECEAVLEQMSIPMEDVSEMQDAFTEIFNEY